MNAVYMSMTEYISGEKQLIIYSLLKNANLL